MSYRLEDSYSDGQQVTLPGGLVFPVPSLIQDEQGSKALLILGDVVPVTVYANAVIAGAESLIRSDTLRSCSVAYFKEQSLLDSERAIYNLPEFVWDREADPVLLVAPEASQPQEEPASQNHTENGTVVPIFAQLHTHSEHSALDGLSGVQEIVDRAVELGHTSVAITDHGNVAGHPAFQDACDEAGIKPIFGMEAYFVDDRFTRGERGDYQHLVIWAMDDEGLANLWAMSTEAYRDGMHHYPRLDWDTLERLNKGTMISSACLRGPLLEPYLKGDTTKAIQNLSRLQDIYGDRFYIEIHINQLEEQIKANKWLVEQARQFEIPLVAAVDSHYTHDDQQDDHQVWISMQINKDVDEESSLFGGGQKYHMATDDEVIENLLYLGEDVVIESMSNAVAISDRCDARIRPREGMPIYSVGKDPEQQDADRMLEMCFDRWNERTLGKNPSQEEYVARFEREAHLLIDKGFPGYFLMNADLVNHAKSNGVLVGPGRGSGAGSLVAYLMGITEIDPVENDLLFERFMTEGRTALPDFDIDYPSSRKAYMQEYAQSRWGKNHVTAVGTHTRIRNKGAFKDTARAIKSRLPEDHYQDLEKISAIIGAAEASTAGLGLSWDELMDAAGDLLEPFCQKMPYLFEMAAKFRGRLKTYSRHAAGLVIDPNCDLEEVLPMFLSSDGTTLVTQFDKDVLEKLNYVKFDFLNLRNLDTIQDTVDLIKAQTGVVINVNKWREEYNDQDVYGMLSDGWTLGVFQLETTLGTRTIKQVKPKNLADISDSITVARPGPMRSGLDKMFFRRRNGEESVSFPEPRLAKVLAKTYGAMLYQEDIMATCMILAGYDDNEADKVRKILGKKQKEKVEAEGIKFIERAVANGTNEQVAIDIWADMAEFALYSFNRAHAFAYGTLSYWTAWFKYHYSAQFMTACLSTIENDEIPDFVSETRRLGYKVLPPDINTSNKGFYNVGDTIRYGFMSLKGIGDAAADAILQGQPYSTWDDFMERKGDKCNMGHIKLLTQIGAFDSLVPNRLALEMRLYEEDVKASERCIFSEPKLNEWGLPCGFDWASEPPPIGRTGKPTKPKPVPKRCTKACRQFEMRALPDDDEVEPHTDEQIRNTEMSMLGVYLSSSPFDKIDPEDMSLLITANDLQTSPNGSYLTAVIITSARDHLQSDGRKMKFIKALTPSGDIDLTVFSSTLDEYGQHIKVGQMGLAEVRKNDRGVALSILQPI